MHYANASLLSCAHQSTPGAGRFSSPTGMSPLGDFSPNEEPSGRAHNTSAAPHIPSAIFPKLAWSLILACRGQHSTQTLRACNQLQNVLLDLSVPPDTLTDIVIL